MKKKITFILALALTVLPSCSKLFQPDSTAGLPSKSFTFHVKGTFDTNYEDMTKAATRLENGNTAGLTDLWVLDYSEDGSLLQQTHQSSTDADFGTVSMELTYGHHDIKFIASKGAGASLTDEGISWTKVGDTFALDYAVDVVVSSNGNRAPELKRVISGLKITINDEIPATATKAVLTLGKRSQSLTLPELSALPYEQSGAELDITGLAGKTGRQVAIYSLADGDDEWESTASIEVLNASGARLTYVEIPTVKLKRNRMTVLSGDLFNRSSGFEVNILSDWDEPEEGIF